MVLPGILLFLMNRHYVSVNALFLHAGKLHIKTFKQNM